MKRFQTTAARRRTLQLIFAAAGGVALLALVAAIVALSIPETTPQTVDGAAGTDATSNTDATSSTGSTSGSGVVSDTMPIPATGRSATTATSEMATGYVVVIDPGHQAEANSDREPIGPGSDETKAKVSSGTRSVNTGAPESLLVLTVSLKLCDSLQAHGIQVVMTRTSQDVDISNIERAQIANDAHADLFVRIHADGATDPSIQGVLMLYPADTPGWTDDIAVESERAARLALESLVSSTGAENRGMVARTDITGFNWSDVPVILPEIGLMTNEAEDALLATDDYQDKIVFGLTEAILNYLGVR